MEVYILAIAILLPILYLLYIIISSPSPPTTTSTTLKGRKAFVVKDVKPWNISGKVKLINENQIWSATAEEKLERGTKVKITGVEGVHVVVEETD